jgi:uncharacterized membrane protein
MSIKKSSKFIWKYWKKFHTLAKAKQMQTNMKIIKDRKRRSEPLTQDEFNSLKKFITEFPTVVDAAIFFGVKRQTLERVLLVGSGSSKTIKAIRKRLNALSAA